MEPEKRFKSVIVSEKQLHGIRYQILREEKQLLELEKKLFQTEKTFENQLTKEFEKTSALEAKTKAEAQHIKKTVSKKIRKLRSKTKRQKVANALLERSVLQQELKVLQAEFEGTLKKAGKK